MSSSSETPELVHKELYDKFNIGQVGYYAKVPKHFSYLYTFFQTDPDSVASIKSRRQSVLRIPVIDPDKLYHQLQIYREYKASTIQVGNVNSTLSHKGSLLMNIINMFTSNFP